MKSLVAYREIVCRPYTRAERISDAALHVIGIIAALVGAAVMLTYVVLTRPEPAVLAGTIVYCVCLLLMLTASAAYHMIPAQDWKDMLRRLDQSAIYIKIAGTYTPFAVLSGPGLGYLLAGIWGAAVAGLLLKMLAPNRAIPLALALYLAMGWSGVVAGGDMIAGLAPLTFWLMLAGGAIYTSGVVFFLWESLPFHNTIWHGFVLVATAVFYIAVIAELSHRAPPLG